MGKTVGQPHSGAELDRELPAPRPGGGDHDLRPLVQPVPRIIEGVDRGPRLEMQVAGPVDPLEQVAQERGNVVNVERRIVLARDDQQVLRQRKLPLAEDGVGGREDLLRPADRA